jgi:hypothetical protein
MLKVHLRMVVYKTEHCAGKFFNIIIIAEARKANTVL